MTKKNQQRLIKRNGFTYIELLVVIGIIGILSVLAVISFQGAQKRGRDQQRKSDLAKISTALQLYNARHGHYPPNNTTAERRCDSSRGSTPNSVGSACPIANGSNWDLVNSDLKPLLDEGLMEELPVDPINSATYYYKFEPYTRRDNAAQCSNYTALTQDYGCGFYLATKLESDGTIYCVLVGSTAGTCGASL